jgi:hypothetical protein
LKRIDNTFDLDLRNFLRIAVVIIRTAPEHAARQRMKWLKHPAGLSIDGNRDHTPRFKYSRQAGPVRASRLIESTSPHPSGQHTTS